MTNLLFIFIILNFCLLFILLIKVLRKEHKITNFGFLVILVQTTLLIFALILRALTNGFSLFFIFYICLIPVFIDFIINFKFLKRNKNSYFKQIGNSMANFLDVSFFNYFYKNNGLYYSSRQIFRFIEVSLRNLLVNREKLLFFVLFVPWALFAITLVIEACHGPLIYFSAILFSLNLILFRGALFALRMVEYICLDGIKYSNAENFYFKSIEYNDNLPVYFHQQNNLFTLICQDPYTDKPYLITKEKSLRSILIFNFSYFSALTLRRYLVKYYRSLLNKASLLLLIAVILVFRLRYEQYYLFLDALPMLLFTILWLLSKFFSKSPYLNLELLLSHQRSRREIGFLYQAFLISINGLAKEDVNQDMQYPPNPKPKDFLHFFSKLDHLTDKPTAKFEIPLFFKGFFLIAVLCLLGLLGYSAITFESTRLTEFFIHHFLFATWLGLLIKFCYSVWIFAILFISFFDDIFLFLLKLFFQL